MYVANVVENVLCTHLVRTEGLHSGKFAQGGMQGKAIKISPVFRVLISC